MTASLTDVHGAGRRSGTPSSCRASSGARTPAIIDAPRHWAGGDRPFPGIRRRFSLTAAMRLSGRLLDLWEDKLIGTGTPTGAGGGSTN